VGSTITVNGQQFPVFEIFTNALTEQGKEALGVDAKITVIHTDLSSFMPGLSTRFVSLIFCCEDEIRLNREIDSTCGFLRYSSPRALKEGIGVHLVPWHYAKTPGYRLAEVPRFITQGWLGCSAAVGLCAYLSGKHAPGRLHILNLVDRENLGLEEDSDDDDEIRTFIAGQDGEREKV